MHIGLSHLVHWNDTELHQLSSSPNTHVVYELQDLLWLFLNLCNYNIRHVSGRAEVRFPSSKIDSES